MSTVKVTNIQHGSATNVAMVLDSAGTVKAYSTIGVGNTTPATSGAGITFPATASASSDANTLDDYEEGTWTPTIGGSTTNPSVTYGAQDGRYIKIGSLVWCYVRITTTARSGGTGDFQIKGLPFTPASEYPGGMTGAYSNITQSANSTGLSLRVQANTNNVLLFEQTSISRNQSFLGVTGWAADGEIFASFIHRV